VSALPVIYLFLDEREALLKPLSGYFFKVVAEIFMARCLKIGQEMATEWEFKVAAGRNMPGIIQRFRIILE